MSSSRRPPSPNRGLLLLALIIAAAVSLPVLQSLHKRLHRFSLEVELGSTKRGYATLEFDLGGGFAAENHSTIIVDENLRPRRFRFLPPGDYRAFRLTLPAGTSRATIADARVRGPFGRTLLSIPPARITGESGAGSISRRAGKALISVLPGARTPRVLMPLDPPLSLRTTAATEASLMAFAVAAILGSAWLLLWLGARVHAARQRRLAARIRAAWRWARGNPHKAVVAAAVLTIAINCFPILFQGMSFVSPNAGVLLLYDRWPTLPGYSQTSLENAKGSDIGATMWQNLPYSVLQRRALFEDFELPLWNRYNYSGITLIGQGLHMLGDPLHLLTVIMGAGARSWDFKFVAAKLLFVLGIGWSVLAVTRHLPAALLLTFSSAYIGFFSFRLNHPAFFSMCYAPMVLYCWLKIASARTARDGVPWAWLLVLASMMQAHSGTAKEAYMLLGGAYLSGALALALAREDLRTRLQKAGITAVSIIIFLALNAPSWSAFLDELGKSFTGSLGPLVYQAQPGLAIALFDDIFGRQFNANEDVFNPSANFFILLCFLWSLIRVRDLRRDRLYASIGVPAIAAAALAFGVLPPRVIVRIPFLANIGHVDNTFSCLLIVYLMILGGFGVKAFWERARSPEWPGDLGIVILMTAALLAGYLGLTHAVHRSTTTFLEVGEEVPKSPFFWKYVPSLLAALVVLPLAARRAWMTRRITLTTGTILVLCWAGLHWRHGMYRGQGDYVVNPKVRANLSAPSGALEFVKASTIRPTRTVGFGSVLFPGYNTAAGLESIYGCDPFWNRRYRELIKASGLELDQWRIVIREGTIRELRPFHDFLNVGFYLRSLDAPPADLGELDHAGRFDLEVYQSAGTWPRAFFTNTAARYDSVQEFVAMIKRGDGRPFAAVQAETIREHGIPARLARGNLPGRTVAAAAVWNNSANVTSFRIEAPSAGIVVLTEAFVEDDFRATINGKPARYFRVNHAFKGIVLESPGEYRIAFAYWPRRMTMALAVAGAGIALLAAWILVHLFRSRRNRRFPPRPADPRTRSRAR